MRDVPTLNILTSTRRALSPADVAALDTLVPGGLHSSWLEFLLRHNVAVPERPWCGSRGFAVSHFFGVSPVAAEDFAASIARYRGRLAARHVPIAYTERRNLICMDAKGRIFYWDHERHDRAADNEDRLGEVEPPIQVAATLQEFLESLTPMLASPTVQPEEVNTVVRRDCFDELVQDFKIDDGQ